MACNWIPNTYVHKVHILFVNFQSQNLVSSECDEGLSTSPLNK